MKMYSVIDTVVSPFTCVCVHVQYTCICVRIGGEVSFMVVALCISCDTEMGDCQH